MDNTLKKLKDISSDCCVTIILNTHRTKPDNAKDSIALKNLIKEAETRLTDGYDKRVASTIIEKLRKLGEGINYRNNLDSLVLFVNEDIAEYIRLPLPVEDRVIIDKTFATRDLVRAMHREFPYYVLVLSRDKARLIEALSNKVNKEIEDVFPIENTVLNPSQRAEAAIANRLTNFNLEFFNRVDKQLNEVLKKNPLPVIICTEESNYPEYLKIADRKELIIGQLNGNKLMEKAHHIIDEAWVVAKELKNEKNRQRLGELSAAVNSRNFVTDFNDIWKAIEEGRGKTLFVQQGYFQPARLVNNLIELVSPEESNRADVIDDIIDEMIEKNLDKGGDAVFLSEQELKDYQGLVLITRY
jgi:hypothetical protein